MRKKFLIEIIVKQRLQEIGIPVFFNFQEKLIGNQIKKQAEKMGINKITSNEDIGILYEELKNLFGKQHEREKNFLKRCGFLPLKDEMFQNYQKEYDKKEIENEFYLLIKFLRDDPNVSLFYTTRRKRGGNNNSLEENKLDERNYNSLIYKEISSKKERIDISKFINMLEQHILANSSSKIENEQIIERAISRYKLLSMLIMLSINKKVLEKFFPKNEYSTQNVQNSHKILLNEIIKDILELKEREKKGTKFSINHLDKKLLYLNTLMYTLIIFNKKNLQKIISIFSNKNLKKQLLNNIEIIQKNIMKESNEINPKEIFEKRKIEYEKKYHVKYKKFNFEDFYKITNKIFSGSKNKQNIFENIKKYINSDLDPKIEDYQEWLLIEKSPENILIKYLTKSLIMFLKKQMLKNNLEYEFLDLKKIKNINNINNKMKNLKEKLEKELKNIKEIEKNEELSILQSEIFKDKIKDIKIIENTKGQVVENIIYKLNSPLGRNLDYKDQVKKYKELLNDFYLELMEYTSYEKVIELKKEYLELFIDIFSKELSFEAFNYVLDILLQELLLLSGRIKIEK